MLCMEVAMELCKRVVALVFVGYMLLKGRFLGEVRCPKPRTADIKYCRLSSKLYCTEKGSLWYEEDVQFQVDEED